MVHKDHVALIETGFVRNSGGVWADVGSGEGAFTLALRDILGSEASIYSVDQNAASLRVQEDQFQKLFPQSNVQLVTGNFMHELSIPELDGIIAANSIHYEEDTQSAIDHLKKYLKPHGTLLVVEYNVDTGNRWVPYPFSYQTFEKIAKHSGAKEIHHIGSIRSDFLTEIYAAKATY